MTFVHPHSVQVLFLRAKKCLPTSDSASNSPNPPHANSPNRAGPSERPPPSSSPFGMRPCGLAAARGRAVESLAHSLGTCRVSACGLRHGIKSIQSPSTKRLKPHRPIVLKLHKPLNGPCEACESGPLLIFSKNQTYRHLEGVCLTTPAQFLKIEFEHVCVCMSFHPNSSVTVPISGSNSSPVQPPSSRTSPATLLFSSHLRLWSPSPSPELFDGGAQRLSAWRLRRWRRGSARGGHPRAARPRCGTCSRSTRRGSRCGGWRVGRATATRAVGPGVPSCWEGFGGFTKTGIEESGQPENNKQSELG